jgi:hypothetical protein
MEDNAMTDETDELASLKARVEELERKAKPTEPEKPFVPAPYQRYDPTEGMSMPPSAMEAMIRAEPRGFMRDVVGDNRAPTGRPGMIPSEGGGGGRPSGGDGTGWAPQIGIDVPGGARTQELIEQQVNAALPHGPEWGKPKA